MPDQDWCILLYYIATSYSIATSYYIAMSSYCIGVIASVLLTAASSLSITTTQTSVSIPFGQTVMLNCSAVGSQDTPPLTLTWTTSANISLSKVVTQQPSSPTIADSLTLASVNTSYRGVYTCAVNDTTGVVQTATFVVNVLVTSSSPYVTITPSGLIFVQTNATLVCNPGDGVGGVTIQAYQWSKGNVSLQDGGRLSGSAQAILRIKSVMLEDQGSYRCTVSNVDGVTASSVPALLNITASSLIITTTKTSISIPFGQTAMLNCSAVGSQDTPPLTLTWTTSANISLSKVVTQQQSSPTIADSLTLASVNTSYRGVYTCAVNGTTRAAQAFIMVNVSVQLRSPSVTVTPSGLISVGVNATLVCNPGDGVGGATIQAYQWSKGNVLLQGGGRFSGSAQATLRIAAVMLEDQGSYRCTVVNVDGVTASSVPALLNVTGPSFVVRLSTSISVKATTQLTLLCAASNPPGSPPLIASWSVPQAPGDRLVTSLTTMATNRILTTSLNVINASSSDSGTYTCSFSNSGLKSGINSSALVSVLYPPHIVSFQSLSNTTTITAQSSLILQCDVATLFPPLTSLVITRTWNGVTVSVAVANVSSYRVTYYVRPSQVNDSGVYWCKASSTAGNDSSKLTVIVKDRPQPIDVSTISHQFLSLSTILVMWGHPPDNNDIITNYSLTACLPTGPCSSVSVDVPSLTARVTSYGYNQTYTVAIRAFNGVGGSDATTYFFRSPGSELATPTNFEVLFFFDGGILVSWRLPDLGDPSLHSMVIVKSFILCYSALHTPSCSVVPFSDVFYSTKHTLGCVLLGFLPSWTYNITLRAQYTVPSIASSPATIQTSLPFMAGRSSLDYHILQALNGQSMLLLSWDGVLTPSTLSFVDSYVVSYAPLSQDGSAFKNYTNFTTSTSSALFDIKLNTNYSIMVSAWFNTLGGLTLAPLVNKGFTIDTSAEVGSSSQSQSLASSPVIVGVVIGVVIIITIFVIVIVILSVRVIRLRSTTGSPVLLSLPERLAGSHQVSSVSIPLGECAAYMSTMRPISSMYECPVSSHSIEIADRVQHVYDRVK